MTSGYGTAYGAVDPRTTEGTVGRRLFGYLIDIVVLFFLGALLAVAISILGVLTLGLGWLLFPILGIPVAVLYNAFTISGSSQATIGMRMAGLRVLDATTGGRVSFIAAAVHALLFYVFIASAGLLLAIDILFGLVRSDRRMGRDLLTNVVLVRD
jgi:uncharacterized RDD family membrane protein YckC